MSEEKRKTEAAFLIEFKKIITPDDTQEVCLCVYVVKCRDLGELGGGLGSGGVWGLGEVLWGFGGRLRGFWGGSGGC